MKQMNANHYSLALLLASTLVSASAAQGHARPFEDIGYEVTGEGYTLQLEAAGTTAPGDVVDLDVTGGPPNATLVIYFTPPEYGTYFGHPLVPGTSRSFLETFDSYGEASIQIIWPTSAAAGDEFAVQADTRTPGNFLARSNAVIGTTMSGAEAAAYDYAQVASTGWQDVSVSSVEEVLLISNQQELETSLDMIVDDAWYPKASEDDFGHSFNLATLSMAGISSEEVAVFREEVRAYVTTGDTLVKVYWSHGTLGDFEGYSVFDSTTSGVGFDSFELFMPDSFPSPQLLTPSAGGFRTTPVDVGSEWIFGYQARVQGEVAVGCDSSGNVQGCSMNATSTSPAPTWDAQHNFECNTGATDNCCYCTFNVAIASGFTSINADGVGGFTLSGNIGYDLNKSYAMKGCCE